MESLRSLASTGLDIHLQPLGDLSTTVTGDLKVSFGVESIEDSFLRRLHTPSQGYVRWITTPDGLIQIGSGYGNEVYNYLSSPLTPSSLQLIREAIEKVARQDSRILVLEVRADRTSNTNVNVNLSYYIKGENALQVIQTELTRVP